MPFAPASSRPGTCLHTTPETGKSLSGKGRPLRFLLRRARRRGCLPGRLQTTEMFRRDGAPLGRIRPPKTKGGAAGEQSGSTAGSPRSVPGGRRRPNPARPDGRRMRRAGPSSGRAGGHNRPPGRPCGGEGDTGFTCAFALSSGVFSPLAPDAPVDVSIVGGEADLLAVFRHELAPLKALLGGKVRVRGDRAALMRFAPFL